MNKVWREKQMISENFEYGLKKSQPIWGIVIAVLAIIWGIYLQGKSANLPFT